MAMIFRGGTREEVRSSECGAALATSRTRECNVDAGRLERVEAGASERRWCRCPGERSRALSKLRRAVLVVNASKRRRRLAATFSLKAHVEQDEPVVVGVAQ